MADYRMESLSAEINPRGGQTGARACADEWTARTPEKPRFVAGVLGPTNRTASISPWTSTTRFRNITFFDRAGGRLPRIRYSPQSAGEGGRSDPD